MGRFSDIAADDGSETEVDISPLMDCVFILLIFFIVTTTFVEESGIEVDKPQPSASQPLDSENDTVVLELTAKGEVLHEGREIKVAGVRPLVKQMLRSFGADVPVIIQADEGSRSGTLARILDEAKVAGADKVTLAQRKAAR